MRTTQGIANRAFRFFAAVGLLFLAFVELDVMSGSIWGIAVAAIGVALLVAGLVEYCRPAAFAR